MLNINPVKDNIEFLFNGDEIVIKNIKNKFIVTILVTARLSPHNSFFDALKNHISFYSKYFIFLSKNFIL